MRKKIITKLAFLTVLFSFSIAFGEEAATMTPRTVRGADSHAVNAAVVKNPSRAELRTRVRAYRDAMRAAVKQTEGTGSVK